MKARTISVLSLFLLPAYLWAQPSDANFEEYSGQVTGDDVQVRSGPGKAFRACTKLNKGDKVTVVGKYREWLKIKPVEGTFSVISKDYVELNAGKDAGVVTGDNVWTRASGKLLDLPQVRMYALHVKLKKGAKVKVLGQAGDFYKIEPKPGAFYWIHGDYVNKATTKTKPADTADDRTADDRTADVRPTTQPTTQPVAREDDKDDEDDIVTTTQPVEKLDAEIAAFRAAEKELKDELKKPAAQRDYRKLLERFKAIKLEEDSSLERYVNAYVRYLQRAMARRELQDKAEELVQDLETEMKRIDLERTKLEVDVDQEQVSPFAAKGILVPSQVFTGAGDLPELYIVRDPNNRKVVAYVQASPLVKSFKGKYVGIIGPSTFRKSLRRDVIDAQEVKPLGDGDQPLEDVDIPTTKETTTQTTE
ncbi:MAG: SH3 domain-containing protein [Phycisphaerae bacterium]